MTKEEFKKEIERPIDKLKIADTVSCEEANRVFWIRIRLAATIASTLRLCLKYPDLAQEYLDSLPKAKMA